ncbi:hypothetical protein NQ317_003357 [Molorchus minor]|uniref:Uncharacterized protein n=1 Tax=Molorchus minor TaxID=1323400 RepID=A0ABQ9K8V4_9CUCU|nr:hypothetical protein NQ317_003357 [Molorchus minor]
MLWMLWRHLRSTNRMREDRGLKRLGYSQIESSIYNVIWLYAKLMHVAGDTENILLQINPNSSSSTSSSDSNSTSNDDDDLDGPTGCSAS